MSTKDKQGVKHVQLPGADAAASPSGKKPVKRSGKLPPGLLPPGRGEGKKAKNTTSKVEQIKAESNFLRGETAAQLQETTSHFKEAGKQVLKFHGVYQQDDRDQRSGGGRQYSFMVRAKIPGGRVTAEQYLAQEELADRYGSGTLRVTTRQDFQLHGILKGDLQEAIRHINETLLTTFGACGDVVRNVVCCPAPEGNPLRLELEQRSQQISDHFLPRTRAYHDIWLDGEKVYNGQQHVETVEPIYGDTYLPRKFKIGIAYPGDNCIDVYSQDVGLIPIAEGETLKGFNVLVGGGLGMTHKKPDTFPRLADLLAFVTPEALIPLLEHIVGIQRDHGNRADRRQARMKYLIHAWGLPRFRKELEQRLGDTLKKPVPMPPFELDLHLGWHRQVDGRYYLGLSVENGRIQDVGARRLKSGLHEIVTRFRPEMRLTANQDVLLSGFRAEDQAEVTSLLEAYGIRQEHELSNARKYAMACPALPTCGLALAESERVLPSFIDQLEVTLADLGLSDEKFSVRMTGCPNGCARPYVSDIGIVGRSLDQYTVFVGGQMDGTRLNKPFKDLVPLGELVATLRPLLVWFKEDRIAGESFGDFCHRVGVDALQAYAEKYEEDHVVTS